MTERNPRANLLSYIDVETLIPRIKNVKSHVFFFKTKTVKIKNYLIKNVAHNALNYSNQMKNSEVKVRSWCA